MADDGSDLEPASHLLGQVYHHLPWVARLDEVLEEYRREVLSEDPLVAEAPQVELEGLGLDQGRFRAVAELQLVEVGLAGDRAGRGQLVGRKLDQRIRVPVAPRHHVEPLRRDRAARLAPQNSILLLLRHVSLPLEKVGTYMITSRFTMFLIENLTRG